MVNVAIIDDGIGVEVYKGIIVKRSIEITPDLEIQDASEMNLLNGSHGTICAAIVSKYCNEVIFTSIKILNDKSHMGKIDQLIKAIEWCMENDIRVANLSLGTINYKDFELLKDVINKAYIKNLIMVAACNNKNVFTYPASCSNVIGVKSGEFYHLKEGEYIFNLYPLDGIEIAACSQHKLTKYNSELKFTHGCNSYAAPMITAEVCKLINKFPHITLEQIKQKLYKTSINYSKNKVGVNSYKNIDWAKDIALLNMNNKDNNFKLPSIDKVTILKDMNDINNNSFDTVVILNESKENYERVNHIIASVERSHKGIIVLDDDVDDYKYQVRYPNSDVKFWSKSVIQHFYENDLPKKEVDVPLIVIYGYTDDKIITVLKVLIDKFKADGYYAGGVCAKTLGILYGLEYIPLNKDINIDDMKSKLETLHAINAYDIIICGLNADNCTINKINTRLKPDKTIIIVDSCVVEKDTYSDDINICIHEIENCIDKSNTLIITSQNNYIKNLHSDYKAFNYNDLETFYNHILNEFLE